MEMFDCTVTESAIFAATKCLESRRLSEGQRVKDFEQALAQQLGLRNPVCTNSGTSALHLALRLAGVGPGDEVILPTQTFIATGLAILYCGATPVFTDVDPATGLLAPESLTGKITDRTKAVIPVHWCGLPCDLIGIRKVTSRLFRGDIAEVEDAAQALGATYGGSPVGTCGYSLYCCFSFQATKHLTTGDGGAVAMWDSEDVYNARRLRWFDLDRLFSECLSANFALGVGYKYHMNDLTAAVGLGNLFGFQSRLYWRQKIGAHYREALQNVPGLKIPPLPPDRTHAYYAFPVLADRREDFHRALKDRGVPSSVICRRIDRHPVFGGLRNDLPGTDHYDAHQINLPCHPGLTDDDVGTVIDAIRKGW